MKVYKIYDIDFDTDGDASLKKELQKKYKELYFSTRKKGLPPADEFVDKISDVTGFCHFSFKYSLIEVIKL